MGKRILHFAPDFLIDMLKKNSGMERSMTVDENALPDDTVFIGYEQGAGNGVYINFILQSEEWMGDSREPLQAPTVTTHWTEGSK